jgi:hypothetical protein
MWKVGGRQVKSAREAASAWARNAFFPVWGAARFISGTLNWIFG